VAGRRRRSTACSPQSTARARWRRTPPQAARPDWAGFATLTAGLVSLVYGLIRAGESTWSDAGVVICLALAAVFLAGFVAVERRAEHPLFDLSLFRVPTFSGGLAAAFAMNGSLYAMLLYLVLYLQDDLGYSALGTGLRLLVMSGVTLVAATAAGRLSTRMPVRWLIGPGLLLVGAGLLLMSGLDASSSWTHLIPGFITAGAGSGMVNPPLASTAVGVVTTDCSDDSGAVAYSKSGKPVAGEAPGRQAISARVQPFDGTWKVTYLVVEKTGSC
jgi:hypothetical protein